MTTARVVAYALFVAACWSAMHLYRGLGYDAQLYAFQAFAQIHPALKLDLFLQDAMQERLSIFSPFYALVIRLLGLEPAALTLFLLFNVVFATGAWFFMRKLCGPRLAWLAVAFVVSIKGNFGGFSVIRYGEDFFTARTAAEALVMVSLALQVHSHRVAAWTVSCLALAIHPIMALPGMLLLICLSLPMRLCIAGAALGIVGAVVLALAAMSSAVVAHHFPLLDGDWLSVVRERSQYLLLDMWAPADWKLNAKPFVALLLTVLAVPDPAIRRLSLAAILIGATGLAVAAIGCLVGPLAILVQAQPWRLMWITLALAILLLPMTASRIWDDRRVALPCLAFMMLAWTYPLIDPLLSAAVATVLWAMRGSVTQAAAQWLRWLGLAVIAIMAVWMIANVWTTLHARFAIGHDTLFISAVRNTLGLTTPMLVTTVTLWWLIGNRQLRGLIVSVLLLGIALLFLVPSACRQESPLDATYSTGEYSDWQRLISEDKSVALASPGAATLFTWFILQRSSYLSEAQSAGVVFSRSTALEVKRRSQVLAPLMDPDWKITSQILAFAKDRKSYKPPALHPLTPTILAGICTDPQLGVVIAREDVGFDAHKHTGAGPWKDWSLYDCAHVRNITR